MEVRFLMNFWLRAEHNIPLSIAVFEWQPFLFFALCCYRWWKMDLLFQQKINKIGVITRNQCQQQNKVSIQRKGFLYLVGYEICQLCVAGTWKDCCNLSNQILVAIWVPGFQTFNNNNKYFKSNGGKVEAERHLK